ncbi:MAG: SMP-30/gluconolactonase/LRE family protein [Myxococcales bacterium]|nr:SMP-30/gluconolactonase/LRE family protein [Myxococcales bacterium]
MRRAVLIAAASLLVAVFLWLLLWPVAVAPVAWKAPPNPGYTGPYAPNTRLAAAELLPLGGRHGPEDLAVDAQGRVYTATHGGDILRFDPGATAPVVVAHTGGRPLGIEFGPDGRLYVADAFRGLLAVTPDGSITLLADTADGVPIVYADDLDIAPDGTVYFSDASTRFSARAIGDTYAASVLDINEHGGHGRLLAWHPDGTVTTVLSGLQFANGVALGHDGDSVLVVETGSYRIIRHHLRGPKQGTTETVIEGFPGFPDNLARGRDGRYWVGLVSPRSKILDALSDSPFLRKVVERLPAFVRPKATPHGHVIAFDDTGAVLVDLQAPDGPPLYTTGALETDDHLYVSSLRDGHLARLPRVEVLPR